MTAHKAAREPQNLGTSQCVLRQDCWLRLRFARRLWPGRRRRRHRRARRARPLPRRARRRRRSRSSRPARPATIRTRSASPAPLEIDTTGGPGFGFEHFKELDFLKDKEVVLTFDDGPWEKNTEMVLKALADECTTGIFFEIGKHATYYPEIAKKVYERRPHHRHAHLVA